MQRLVVRAGRRRRSRRRNPAHRAGTRTVGANGEAGAGDDRWPLHDGTRSGDLRHHVSGAEANVSAPDIFIVGPARSGTSWLQTMLAEHPDLASPPETGLFVEFLAPMERAWQRHIAQLEAARAEGSRMNVQGMATVVTSADMLAWYRTLYDTARERVFAGKPGAMRLLEKTPDHAMCLDVIWKVVPD